MENPALMNLLRQTNGEKRSKASTILKMFKLFPLLSSGCKMVALLGRPHKGLLTNCKAMTGTLFGCRRGRVCLTIQEDPKSIPIFVIELPILTGILQKEMSTGLVRIALESETKTSRKKLLEEYVWAVFCNGHKTGYSIRRKQTSEDEIHVMQMLRGVSMGAGVLPSTSETDSGGDGDMAYIRGRFERVIGSKDSEAFYMVNPDGSGEPELSFFFVRGH